MNNSDRDPVFEAKKVLDKMRTQFHWQYLEQKLDTYDKFLKVLETTPEKVDIFLIGSLLDHAYQIINVFKNELKHYDNNN